MVDIDAGALRDVEDAERQTVVPRPLFGWIDFDDKIQRQKSDAVFLRRRFNFRGFDVRIDAAHSCSSAAIIWLSRRVHAAGEVTAAWTRRLSNHFLPYPGTIITGSLGSGAAGSM